MERCNERLLGKGSATAKIILSRLQRWQGRLDFLIPTQACLAIFATSAKQILQLRSLSLQSSITSLS